MSIDLSVMTTPFQDLDDYPGPPWPTIATVREIDAEVVDNEISFFFSQANYEVDLSAYPGGLTGLLNKVRARTASLPDTIGIRPQPPVPPLALRNRALCYVIYVLSEKNWQFARSHAPFSIGKTGHAKECHFHARRIDGQGTADKVKDGAPEKDDCMVAYFISDGRKATGFTGQYQHALNIHVDLRYGGANKARMPVIIDPDVRFPGGSGN